MLQKKPSKLLMKSYYHLASEIKRKKTIILRSFKKNPPKWDLSTERRLKKIIGETMKTAIFRYVLGNKDPTVEFKQSLLHWFKKRPTSD